MSLQTNLILQQTLTSPNENNLNRDIEFKEIKYDTPI